MDTSPELPAAPTVPPTIVVTRSPLWKKPRGATNYGAKSFLAQQMKHKGLDWRLELIDCYKLYKKGVEAQLADPNKPNPDPELLHFWVGMLPYITLKISEQETRRTRLKRQRPNSHITKAALERLSRLEGRPESE